MEFSQIELKTIEQIAHGNKHINKITATLERDKSWIYRTKQKLKEKDIITFSNGTLEPRKHTHITLLLQLLIKYPTIIPIISESGIPILTSALNQKTIEEITKETGLKKSIIYKKIKQAINVSIIIRKQNKKYVLNDKIWNDLIRFLEELKKYEETTDPRIPANSTIYFKNKKEIVFSSKEKLDAVLTSFSTYTNYGIKILLSMNYYYIPKKQLSKKEVFLHSLYITEKEKNSRHLTYIALFYLKYKKELLKVKHSIITNINKILRGENIQGYPSFDEIKEKAEVYDIRL